MAGICLHSLGLFTVTSTVFRGIKVIVKVLKVNVLNVVGERLYILSSKISVIYILFYLKCSLELFCK